MSPNNAYLAHQFDDLDQQHEAATLGMWTFLATEVLVFGALFTGYAVYRWKYPDAFAVASEHLNVLIGAVNTIVLLTSSLTMALAVHAVRAGRQKALVNCLLLTALLGAAFLGLKALEYYEDYEEKLVPGLAFDAGDAKWAAVNPRHAELFYVFYYVMTGLHAVHLTVGIGLLCYIAWRAWRGAYPPANYAPVEVSGLYWHFVDVIWIFLLPLLYLIGERSLSDLHF